MIGTSAMKELNNFYILIIGPVETFLQLRMYSSGLLVNSFYLQISRHFWSINDIINVGTRFFLNVLFGV